MKKRIFLFAAFFLIIFTGQIFSQNLNKSERINFIGLTFTVQAPKEWKIDLDTAKDIQAACLLYEKGKKFDLENDNPSIAITVEPLESDTDKALTDFAEELADQMRREERAEVEIINRQYKNNNTLYLTYNIKRLDERGYYYNTFVFTRYKTYCLVIVLFTASIEELNKLFPKMEEVINSIKFIDK